MDVNIQRAMDLFIQKLNELKAAAAAKGARVGVYRAGGQVTIDGRSYEAVLVSDTYYSDGQIVYVVLSQDGAKAVLLG